MAVVAGKQTLEPKRPSLSVAVFGDTHGDHKLCDITREAVRKADVLVFVGTSTLPSARQETSRGISLTVLCCDDRISMHG